MTDQSLSREKRPTAKKGFLFLIVLAVIAAVLAAFALSLRSEEGPKLPTTAPQPLAVSVAPAQLQPSFELRERFSGIASASRESDLGFIAGGRIDRFAADIGDRVKKGETLASLDTRSLRAQLRASEALVEEARASADIADATLRRQSTLLEQGHVSPQRVEEAMAQSQTAKARVQSAAAQADTLRVQIDLSTVTAPFDGVIVDRFADEGVIAGPSQPILRLVETGPMEARIGVPADVAERLEPGADYSLLVGDRSVPAQLRSETGVIDARSRTVTAVFEISAEAKVPSGSVVRLAVEETIDEDGVWVPVTALTEVSRGVWSVLVAEPEGDTSIARARPVTVIHTDGSRAFVRGVLDDRDLIILEGLQRLTPGQPVLPRNGAFAGRSTSAE
ncbi:MAG: efflux RND transporter periplasmic adaptor subunit [Pseudomonadota bacterium]